MLDDLPPGRRPLVCDISLWEVGLLVQVGRLQLAGPLGDWLTVAASPLTVEVLPITPRVVTEMNRLPARFHNDPADRLIVATARASGHPLATRDGRITRSRLVPLWRG